MLEWDVCVRALKYSIHWTNVDQKEERLIHTLTSAICAEIDSNVSIACYSSLLIDHSASTNNHVNVAPWLHEVEGRRAIWQWTATINNPMGDDRMCASMFHLSSPKISHFSSNGIEVFPFWISRSSARRKQDNGSGSVRIRFMSNHMFNQIDASSDSPGRTAISECVVPRDEMLFDIRELSSMHTCGEEMDRMPSERKRNDSTSF